MLFLGKWLSGRRPASAADREDNFDEEATAVPLSYRDCRTKAQKLAWLDSPQGQDVLSARPVLKQFYDAGRLQRLVDNPHWKTRLEEWLAVNGSWGQQPASRAAVPFGLSLPLTDMEKERNRNNWLGRRGSHPPLAEVFRAAYEAHRLESCPLQNKLELLADGFTIFRSVIPDDLVEAARCAIADLLDESHVFDYLAAKKKDPDARPPVEALRREDPHFLSGTTNDLNVLGLYYATPIHTLVESLLHGEEYMRSQGFRVSAHGAQVAYRFSQPMPEHHRYNSKLGGKGWHIDGLQFGEYGSFSFLVGVALNDQDGDFSGNFCVHPASHYTLQTYLKDYALQSAASSSAEEKIAHARLSRPDLGEPVQVRLRAGDAVLALHKVAHRGGPNYSPHVRKMVFFRVSHRNHQHLRFDALDDIWIEYEGLRDLVT